MIIGLDHLYNSNYISGLSLDNLLALNNFWYNRFIKEMDTYFESIYSIHQLNLFPKMLNNSFNPDELSETDIENIVLKMNFLYLPTRSYWEYASKLDSTQIEQEKLPDKNYYFFSNKPLINNLKQNFGEKYNDFFNNITPNSELEKDLNLYWKLFTPIINGYLIKDSSIISTLALNESLNFSSNYGIVLDSNILYDTNPNMQLNFWIDFKGLNFPLREHIPANVLRNFLIDYNGNCMVPIYMGSEAFSGIPSHILFPLTKKQTSFIKNAKKDNFKEYSNNERAIKFLKHSAFLLNPKLNKKQSEGFFIDLNDYKLYKKDIDGNYKHITNKSFDNYDAPDFN